MAEFLLECYSEEIPASYQQPAAEQLLNGFMRRLREAFGEDISAEAKAYVTPKRLVLHVTGIPAATEAKEEEERGPREGAPAKAVEGFAKARGIAPEALALKDTPKGRFYFYTRKTESVSAAGPVAEAAGAALAAISWPKSMLWGAYALRWPRPLLNILSLFDGKAVPVTLGHLTGNDITYTGSPLRREKHYIASFDAYRAVLKERAIILCRDERIAFIEAEAEKAAQEHDVQPLRDPSLIEEIAGLAERPLPMTGRFDESFLSLPSELLFSVMKTHQRYIPFTDENGKAAPLFFFIAEGTADDIGAKTVSGNEKVLRARLQDAAFFEAKDKETKSEALRDKLKGITFHADLGTVYEKAERLSSLAKLTAMWVPGANLVHVERAALLCKCDLATHMVGEFPELQGFAGGYYARCEGEPEDVALAIEEHYLPAGPGSKCPHVPVSAALAIADKTDSFTGLYAAGERATGSRDPYGLRRCALGVIRLITENNLRIPLRLLLEKSLARYPASLFKEDKKGIKRVIPLTGTSAKEKKNALIDEMFGFFRDRLRALLRDQGVPADLVEAVLHDEEEQDIVRILLKLKALKHFLHEDASAEALITVYKRASGIVAQQEKNAGVHYGDAPVNEQLLSSDEEKNLYKRLTALRGDVQKKTAEDAFSPVFQRYAEALPDIERFFDNVTVNDDNKELRENRLHLLGHLRDLMLSVADFSRLSAEEKTAGRGAKEDEKAG